MKISQRDLDAKTSLAQKLRELHEELETTVQQTNEQIQSLNKTLGAKKAEYEGVLDDIKELIQKFIARLESERERNFERLQEDERLELLEEQLQEWRLLLEKAEGFELDLVDLLPKVMECVSDDLDNLEAEE